MKFYKLIFIFIFIFINFLPDTAQAKSCRFYPYKIGLKIKNKKKDNLKIYSTSVVKVYFDDFDEIEDAYTEAENNAIIKIARFLQTAVKYNKKYFLSIDNQQINDEEKTKNTDKEIAKSNFYSEVTLSGIKTIKKCYEKNNFVKVTVLFDEKNYKNANKLKSILKD